MSTEMDKWAIARTLDEIGRYIELSESNPFKSRAFDKAARSIEALDREPAELVARGGLQSVPGIGKATGAIVEELVASGRSQYLEELRAQYPPGIFELLRVPGLGLKKIGMLYSEFGIGSLDELETAARSGRIARLRGFGAKTQQKILEGIEMARRRTTQFLLPAALESGEAVRARLAQLAEISDAEVSGSVRRRLEIVDNVEVVVCAADLERAIAAITKRAVVDRLEAIDETRLRGFARDGIEVLLHLTTAEDLGAAMLVTTGSREFVEAFARKIEDGGWALRDRKLYRNDRHVPADSEHDLFACAGISFVEPETRENGDMLRRKTRPRLVDVADLKGTFHVHTTFSDGRNTVREMLDAARDRGFEYVGISDHSQNAYYARGLALDDLERQHAEIDRERASVEPMRVFRGTEADILDDGAIDYGPETLSRFDFVIASIHSRFGMDEQQMTARMLRALDDPFVTILGHLTGRLLLRRKGYAIDFDRVFDRAAERGVMIEINGNPHRLELDWRLVKRAVDRGVLLCINPDAHSINELSHVVSGTWLARKGGLAAKHIFNTRPVDEVAAYLAARRERAMKA